jgi:hypothetical protein
MWFPAADTIAFSEGGAEAVRIDSSGNVGIGTSSISQRLTVAGAGTAARIEVINTSDSDRGGYLRDTGSAFELGTNSGVRPLAFAYDGSEKARIDTSGNLLVGTTSVIQSGKISQTGGSFAGTHAGVVFDGGRLTSNGDMAYFRSTTTLAGYITITGANTCTYNSVSDVRLKENIVDAPSALAKVESLQVRSFDWKDGTGAVPYGFIAQELNEVVPEAVSHGTTNEDGSMLTPWGIDTSLLVPYLTKAFQELKAIIDTQATRIAALEAK